MVSFSAVGQSEKTLPPVEVSVDLPTAIKLPGQSVVTLTDDPENE
jgi:hypothetical protein